MPWAPTPSLLAQELGKAAQQRLDDATARLPALHRARRDLDQLLSSEDDGFLVLLSRRMAEGNTEGILEADRLGHEVVQRIIGPAEEPTEGSGLGVLWVSTFAQVLFDYDRFCSLAATLYRLLAVPGPFDALVNDAEWRGRHQRALTAIVDSSDTLQNMLAVAQHDRAAVRSVLLFVQDIYQRGASTQPEKGQSLLSPDRVVRLLMASSGLSDVSVEITAAAKHHIS